MRYSVRYHYSSGATGPTVFNTWEKAIDFTKSYLYSGACALLGKCPLFISIEETDVCAYIPIFPHYEHGEVKG